MSERDEQWQSGEHVEEEDVGEVYEDNQGNNNNPFHQNNFNNY